MNATPAQIRALSDGMEAVTTAVTTVRTETELIQALGDAQWQASMLRSADALQQLVDAAGAFWSSGQIQRALDTMAQAVAGAERMMELVRERALDVGFTALGWRISGGAEATDQAVEALGNAGAALADAGASIGGGILKAIGIVLGGVLLVGLAVYAVKKATA